MTISEQTMKNSYEFVFVKFYSPMCSHCHTMAPSWRELALQLNTVVKIAVINCADERMLCRQEGISSYPSLVLYPSVCSITYHNWTQFYWINHTFHFLERKILRRSNSRRSTKLCTWKITCVLGRNIELRNAGFNSWSWEKFTMALHHLLLWHQRLSYMANPHKTVLLFCKWTL